MTSPAGDRTQRVFLVYGRNHDAHHTLEALLKTLGLDVVDWEAGVARTGKTAPHATEVLKAAMATVGAVVVLMSGDEEARLRQEFCAEHEFETEGTLAPQARPNVLFEAGLAFALFPDRTILVQLGRLRPLSDLSGVQYVPLDASPETQRALANRLRIAGCRVRPPGEASRLSGLPSPDAGLPPLRADADGSAGSVALLRRLKSLFSVAAMGGNLEVAESAEIGTKVILSIRVSDADGMEPGLQHWMPGAASPRRIPISSRDAKDGSIELPFVVPGPAGIHYFDLLNLRAGAPDLVVARTACSVSEP